MTTGYNTCPVLPGGNLPPTTWSAAEASFSTGRLSLKVTGVWSDDGPGPVIPELQNMADVCVVLDGRMVYRNSGRDQFNCYLSPPVATKVGNTRTYALEINPTYLGLSPGKHTLEFGFLIKVDGWPDYPPSARYTQPFLLQVPQGAFSPPPQPARQVIMGKVLTSVFILTPDEFTQRGLNPAVIKSLNIDAVEVGMFMNPADWYVGDINDPAWQSQVLGVTLAQWEQSWRPWLTTRLDWCRANQFKAVYTGDDLFRSPKERYWWVHCPWRDTALRKLRDLLISYSDVSTCVMALDETEFVFGPDPTDEGVNAEALLVLWREVPGAPLWCWPGQDPGTYETAVRSDMSCRYIREAGVELSAMVGRGGRTPAQMGVIYDLMRNSLFNAALTRPVACQVSSMGDNYRKKSAGDAYRHGHDELADWGMRPEDAPAYVWLPVVLCGARMLRAYMYDLTDSQSQRRSAAVPSNHQNVGVCPGDGRMEAMGKAFASVKGREQALCSRTPLPGAFRDGWATGGVEGLRVAINCSTTSRDNPHFPGGVVLTSSGEVPYAGVVRPGEVVLES